MIGWLLWVVQPGLPTGVGILGWQLTLARFLSTLFLPVAGFIVQSLTRVIG